MCADCAAQAGLCQACLALVGPKPFLFRRDAHDFSQLWDYVFTQFKKDPVMLSVAALIMIAVSSVGSVISQVASSVGQIVLKQNWLMGVLLLAGGAVVGLAAGVVLQGIVQMGFARLCFDVLQGGKVELARLFSQAKHLGQYVLQWLVIITAAIVAVLPVGLAVVAAVALGFVNRTSIKLPVVATLFVLVVVVAAFAVAIWASPVVMAPYELVYAGGSGVAALRRAFAIGQGHRLELVGYLMVGGLLGFVALVLGVLMLCVGLTVTIPVAVALHQLLMTTKFLALREGCEGMPPAQVEVSP